MGSNLSCYQLKIDCYRCKLLYVSLVVTTKQKPRVNTQKTKRKKYRHITKESHQTTKKEYEKNRELQNQPENNYKMAISTYLSIVTLDINGLNTRIKTEWLNEFKTNKTRPTYMLPTRNSLSLKRQTDCKWNYGKRYSNVNGNQKKKKPE